MIRSLLRPLSFTLVLAFFLISASPRTNAVANPSPFSAANVRFDDEVLTVEVEGDYAYVGLASGMAILDITHPTQAFITGIISGEPNHNYTITLAVADDLVITSGGGSTFRIIDVSDSHHPIRLFSEPYFAFSDVRDIAVYGDYAYVADDLDLVVVDISVPTDPEIVGRVDNRGMLRALDVAEDADTGRIYVYLVGDAYPAPGVGSEPAIGGGLRVIDVTNPHDPQEVWPCSNDDPCPDDHPMTDIAVQDGYAYISYWEWDKGLNIWDISDVNQPRFIRNYLTDNAARRVAVGGDHAYIGVEGTDILGPRRMHTIDVADKAQPRGIGVQEMASEYPAGIASSAAKGCLFAAERANGLRIVCDASVTPTPPSHVWLPLLITAASH